MPNRTKDDDNPNALYGAGYQTIDGAIAAAKDAAALQRTPFSVLNRGTFNYDVVKGEAFGACFVAEPGARIEALAKLYPNATVESLEAHMKREQRGAGAIAVFTDGAANDNETNLGDLLADLLHWADANDVDFLAALDNARRHFRAELAELAAEEGETLTGDEPVVEVVEGEPTPQEPEPARHRHTLAALRKANPDEPDLDALRDEGEVVTIGGGAAARFTVRRLS